MLTSVLYLYAGAPAGLPAILELVAAYLFPASIALWVRADAARRRSRVPYDFDSFVFFFWPLLAPVYLFRTRGWDGCGPVALFVGLLVASLLLQALLGAI